jgi:uncharacterized OB-fold protein
MTRPLAPDLFAQLEPPRLLGGRCAECETVVFPMQDGCPRCSHRPLTAMELPARGVVWSWTTQEFAPKPPFRAPTGGWAPLAVGYVDLGVVIVESWLVPAARDWQIGDEVELTTAVTGADDGEDVLTYAFEAVTVAE